MYAVVSGGDRWYRLPSASFIPLMAFGMFTPRFLASARDKLAALGKRGGKCGNPEWGDCHPLTDKPTWPKLFEEQI
jgi:hypothetical protein